MTTHNAWLTYRRQPLASILLLFLSNGITILKAFWPLILIMIFRPAKGIFLTAEHVLLAIPVIISISAILHYLNFKIKIAEGQIVVKKGVLKKETITIPLDKVQSINIDQNWLHRLINLVRVSIDSPGTEKAEVKINMHERDAHDLKSFLLAHQGENNATEAAPNKVISRLSLSDLFRLGLSANHLETLAIMFGLALSFLSNIKDVIQDEFEKLEASAATLIAQSTMFAFYLLIAILFLSVIVSFFRIVIKYANFTVTSTAKGFSIRSGLINSLEQMVSFDKIQYVSWRANWIRKKLPIFLLEYHSIGNQDLQTKLKVRIPVTSRKLLAQLTNIYQQGIAPEMPFIRVSKAYIFRRTLLMGILPILVVGGAAYPFIGFNVLALIIIPVMVYWSAFLFRKNFRLHYNETLLHLRNGAFGESEVLVKWHKIQSVAIVQGYYQRHNDLADVKLHTAGGRIVMPYLSLSDARDVANYALYKIESNEQSWM